MPVHHSGTQMLQYKQIFLGKNQKDRSSLAHREAMHESRSFTITTMLQSETSTVEHLLPPMQTSKHQVYPLMWMPHHVIPGPNDKTGLTKIL